MAKYYIGNSPFYLVYKREVILPPNIFPPSLQLAQIIEYMECPTIQHRIDTLLKQQEEHESSKYKFHQH